jgi:hypothetical protein
LPQLIRARKPMDIRRAKSRSRVFDTTCVLCAYPNNEFNNRFRKSGVRQIYNNRRTDQFALYSLKNEYIPVVLHDNLVPLGPLHICGGNNTDWAARLGKIDWLFVLKDGVDALPGYAKNARFVGSSAGYSVFTSCEVNFAEFVRAITEATLQSPQIPKVGSSSPPLVQTTTGR